MKLDYTTKGCLHKDVDPFTEPRDGFIGKCYDCGKPIKEVEDE